MVSATFGFVRRAATLADFGTVAITIRSCSVQKPIGTTRGAPSRPMYANRAGSGPLSNCWAYGLARVSAILSAVIVVMVFSVQGRVHPGDEAVIRFSTSIGPATVDDVTEASGVRRSTSSDANAGAWVA